MLCGGDSFSDGFLKSMIRQMEVMLAVLDFRAGDD